MNRRDVLGSGLSTIPYGAILLIAIVVFLFWDGPLWTAAPDVSHVGRIAYSYLLIVPLALGALLATHRFTWTRALTAVGTMWAIKLVVTATLFSILAQGTTERLEPQALPDESPEVSERQARLPPYEPAPGPFAAGSIEGSVRIGSVAAESAIIMLQSPAPGRSLASPASVPIHIANDRYEHALYSVRSGDALLVVNADADFHTLHLHAAGRAGANLPVPPSASRAMPVPEVGLYEMRCDNHPTEHAWLVSVDNPYLVSVGDGGRYVLDGVPSGTVDLSALIMSDGQLRIEEQKGTLAADQTITVDFALP